eukprot:CAMPEP_0201522310 /NCGR_PEP_ID=MMETSP0161_2-20130828/16906_1 /ASSEMBLY_ACC=CAM_ASM_000251 /TAXON_ID=180227 /ORGANISM="Neoparamoeba aestuarina, Strain SoJaBio B1-5/56/2" /LENGTH=274 /DNA_ID=CAMNT_0047921121 /DNA_START=83 /DNA_END=907 /DNA_ORIENTATION=-
MGSSTKPDGSFVVIFTVLFGINLVLLCGNVLPSALRENNHNHKTHDYHHEELSDTYPTHFLLEDVDFKKIDDFKSLAVDFKKAFKEDKLPGISSFPQQVRQATTDRLVTSVLPEVFLTFDQFLHYDFASFAEVGANFTYRMAQTLWDTQHCHDDIGNGFSIVSAFMEKVATVKPLSGASLDVPRQSSWLGGFLLYWTTDLYNVMQDTDQWYRTFNDCEQLMYNYASVQWAGSYKDPDGVTHKWQCGECNNVMDTVGNVCKLIAQQSNQTGLPTM